MCKVINLSEYRSKKEKSAIEKAKESLKEFYGVDTMEEVFKLAGLEEDDFEEKDLVCDVCHIAFDEDVLDKGICKECQEELFGTKVKVTYLYKKDDE